MLTNADIHNFLDDRIDPEAQREGQELVQLDKVTLNKLTSHMVGGIVEGTPVSIRFTPEKVYITKDCSCRTRKCRHLAGLLYKVQSSKKRSFNNKTGYWRRIISEMPESDKASFILEQVKRNKAVAFDLRAFVIRQEGLYAVQHAKEILDELRAPIVRSTKSPTAPQVRLHVQVTKTSIKSADSLLKDGYVYQSLAILSLLLENLYYLHYRLHRNNSSIHNQIQIIEEKMPAWMPLLRAPEAQYDVFDSWKTMTAKSYYLPISMNSEQLFVSALPNSEMKQSALAHIEARIEETQGVKQGMWSSTWLQVLLENEDVNPNLNYESIESVKNESHWMTLMSVSPLPAVLLDFFLWIQGDLTPRQRKKSVAKLVEDNYLEGTLKLLQGYPEILFPGGNDSMAQQLIKNKKRIGALTLDQTCSIYAQCGDSDLILGFLHEKNDLMVTLPLLEQISSSDIAQLDQVIIQQVKAYLSNHIGEQSRKNMEWLLRILSDKGNSSLLKDVKAALKDLYGYRNDVHHVLTSRT